MNDGEWENAWEMDGKAIILLAMYVPTYPLAYSMHSHGNAIDAASDILMGAVHCSKDTAREMANTALTLGRQITWRTYEDRARHGEDCEQHWLSIAAIACAGRKWKIYKRYSIGASL